MTLCYFIEKLKNNFPRSDYAFDDTFVVSGSVSVVQTRVQSYLGGAGPHWRALTDNGPWLTAIQRLIFWAESKHTLSKSRTLLFHLQAKNSTSRLEAFTLKIASKKKQGGRFVVSVRLARHFNHPSFHRLTI